MSETIIEWQRPIIGIALPHTWNYRLHERPRTDPANFHMDAVEHLGLRAYCFVLQDVQLETKTITGWVRVDGEWIRTPVPWPDVYYELPEMEALDGEMPIVDELWRTAITINTARRLGKWQCCDILGRYPDTRQYAPDTVFYQSPRDLAAMLHKHKMVLIKPEIGKTGRGISRVSRGANGRLTWQDSVTNQRVTDLTLDQVLVRARQTAGTDTLAIQQMIPLLRVDGRRSDIRVNMNRDGSGQWQFTFAGLKVGRAGKFVTNVARGGTWYDLPDAQKMLAKDRSRAEQLMAKVYGAAEVITHRLEQEVGSMGEVGYDLAFDTSHKLWFLEANPNPGKAHVSEKGEVGIPRWYTRVFEYARYLWQQR